MTPATPTLPGSAASAAREREPVTRERILESAIDCFTRYGNDKTTINDIARVAGLAHQTVYRYFPDRAAVLEAVELLESERLSAEAQGLADRATSFEEFLAGLVELQVSTTARYRTRQHLIEHDRGLLSSLFLLLERRSRLVRDLVAPQLTAAAVRGELRADLDLASANEWIAIVLGSLLHLTESNVVDLDDPVAVGRFYARHLCRGLTASGEATHNPAARPTAQPIQTPRTRRAHGDRPVR